MQSYKSGNTRLDGDKDGIPCESLCGNEEGQSKSKGNTATVVSVGDGDTIRVREGGRLLTIRLACIDAPEMGQRPSGTIAREALERLAPVGSEVVLQIQTTDRYGRSVAEVFRGEENVNLALVRQGAAFAYPEYLNQCHALSYLSAESQAQYQRAGVWATPGGLTRPWEWRATPSLRSITVEGSRLILRFSEPIQFSSSVGERFAVTVAGGSRSILASQAGATSSELLLTLDGPAPMSSQIVRVLYTDLTGNNDDFGVIQNKAGNDLASIVAPGRAADTFRSSVSVSALAATTTDLVLTGSRAINGTGNNLANTLTGNGAANSLNGGAAADRLIGGGGNDTLTGGFGADIFRFESALNSSTNRDTITDFNRSQGDAIELENAVFKGLTRTGPLALTAFRSGNRFTSASQRVLYNPVNGNLSYDSNGNAAGGVNALIAVMSTKPTLTHSMLIVT